MTPDERERLEHVACSIENAARALTIVAETIREITGTPSAESLFETINVPLYHPDPPEPNEFFAPWTTRLVLDPQVSETSPVVRGTWVTVAMVIDHIVEGWTWADVLRMHPEITADDIRACLEYTIDQDGPVAVGTAKEEETADDHF